MRRLRDIDPLHWKLGLTVAALVIAGLGLSFYLLYEVYSGHHVETANAHAQAQTTLIREALEHQMMRNDKQLMQRMLAAFGERDDVNRVTILGSDGQVAFSSHQAHGPTAFELGDPSCSTCHEREAQHRRAFAVVELEGEEAVRHVQPIANRPACHACHDSEQAIIGVLLVDVPVGSSLRALSSRIGWVGLATALVGMLMLVGFGVVVRRLVLRRLKRLEGTARAIADGDLQRRVPEHGNDALTRLGQTFNEMADSVVGLLGRLEAESARLLRVMNSVDDGVAVLDDELRFVAVNDAFARRFGKEPETYRGRECSGGGSLACAGPGEDCPARRCLATGEVQTAICVHRDDRGKLRHNEVRASPVLDKDGAVTQVVEVWRDITERRSAEARLAEYHRLASLGMLASGFSHEVNTPLASIGTCLAGIGRACRDELDDADAQEIAELTRIARQEVERAGTITQQFLRLARGQSLHGQVLDLAELVGFVARLVSPTARSRGVLLEVRPSQRVPAVLANESAVQQVLLNLVLNAIEASDNGQTVTLSFEVAGDIRVVVTDRGRGMSPEQAEQAFEPFFTTRGDGTGLGLFISQNLAHGWAGDVVLVDTRPGHGTVFAVVFPLPESLHGVIDGAQDAAAG